jgi:hypothetical protein
VIDVGVTPTSDAVLPLVPVHRAASADGEKLKPADVAVADEAGGAVAPPVATPGTAPDAFVACPDEEGADPEPRANPGEVEHGAVVVVDVVEEVELVALGFVVVVVTAALAPGFVVVVDEVVGDEPQGSVVVVAPRASAACPEPAATSAPPPPLAPRYGETRAPHDVATTDSTRTPTSPAVLFFTSAPRTQAPT